jgi:hypothetical protein
MYFSAERLALANQAVKETFAQCSIAWQAIPHWDTGDPGQITVADGKYNPPGFLHVHQNSIPFTVTLAQANAPAPNLLLTEVMAMAAKLATVVDNHVIPRLYTGAGTPLTTTALPAGLLGSLINARAVVENAGYRAPSCLITNTPGLVIFSQLTTTTGSSILGTLIAAANVNSLHRAEDVEPPDSALRAVFLGRRRRIPQGAAAEASPGEEPVDLAISLPPSLEIDGETPTGEIQLTARIRYALRITDAAGLVALHI